MGCKCILTLMLLEPLRRSAIANMMSKKLATLHEWRRHNLERQPRKRAIRRETHNSGNPLECS